MIILMIYNVAARIDDGDQGFEEDDGQQERRVLQFSLRADRWWTEKGLGEVQDKGLCLGIRWNIWARAMRRREITHHL